MTKLSKKKNSLHFTGTFSHAYLCKSGSTKDCSKSYSLTDTVLVNSSRISDQTKNEERISLRLRKYCGMILFCLTPELYYWHNLDSQSSLYLS